MNCCGELGQQQLQAHPWAQAYLYRHKLRSGAHSSATCITCAEPDEGVPKFAAPIAVAPDPQPDEVTALIWSPADPQIIYVGHASGEQVIKLSWLCLFWHSDLQHNLYNFFFAWQYSTGDLSGKQLECR